MARPPTKATRREFLKSAALAGAGVLAGPSAMFGPPSLPAAPPKPKGEYVPKLDKISLQSIETFTRGPVSIVRVRTDGGVEGYGQVSPYNADISVTVLHRQIARHALQADLSDIDGLVDRCTEANYKYPGSYVRRALTGVETAIWDLHGKLQGKSVCQLIGGRPRPITAYGSSMRRDIQPGEEAARLKRLKDTHGYRAFKIRIGKVCGHDQDQWPGRTEALVPAVRKAIGDETALLVDANSCYTPKKAIEVGKLLADNHVCHFEEPCPYWEYEWTAQVTRAIEVPVAGGEQDCMLPGWRRMIAMRAVDIVQPDVCYIGGLARALRVAKMAAKAGMPCVPHSANLSMVTVFTLHVLAAIPNAGPHVEFSIEPTDWVEGIYRPALKVKDGQVAVPDGPGWGVTVNPDWLAKAERQVSKRR